MGNGSGGREKPRGKAFERPFFLANLAKDPTETKNLVEQHPDVVERLEESFERITEGWKDSR